VKYDLSRELPNYFIGKYISQGFILFLFLRGQPRRMLDTSKAETQFGFKAKVKFEEGLKRQLSDISLMKISRFEKISIIDQEKSIGSSLPQNSIGLQYGYNYDLRRWQADSFVLLYR